MVEDERDEVDRRATGALEDALTAVAGDEEAAIFAIAERRDDRTPPAVGEVLRLVDDDRIEPLPVEELLGKLCHAGGKFLLPPADGFLGADALVRAGRRAPFDAEGVEFADVGRLFASTPLEGDAFEEAGKAVRIADERDAQPLAGEPSGLFHCEVGLSTPGTAADFDAREDVRGAQEDRLFAGEGVGDVVVLGGAGENVALGEAAPGEGAADAFGPVGG